MSKLKKALERAKSIRSEGTIEIEKDNKLRRAVKKAQEKEKPQKTVSEEPRSEEVRVSYTHTKVLDINKQNLRENKIFSHIKVDRMTDQINILRTQVLNKLQDIEGNTLMVTSANPGEGKTFTSINLGISIAQQLDRTVLLVDCDLRQPEKNHFDFTTDFFGVEIHQGLSDYLLGQADLEDVLFNPGIERLTVLPGGKPIKNSAELLSSPRMELMVREMKDRYGKDRVIIFDSPSILAISDPLALARFVDGVLLVVETNRSTKEDIKKTMELLKDQVILGAILNKYKPK
jgi:protein-tyrosine kinase